MIDATTRKHQTHLSMEFILILRELAGRWRIVAIGAAVAALVALLSVYRIDGFALKPRSLVHASASTKVLVDSDPSVLGNVSQSFEPLASRASVYANFMTSPQVLELIAHRIGLSGGQLYAAGPVSVDEPRVEQEPTDLKRNIEITGETKPYRLSFESQAGLPTITINSQAPTTDKAVALANAAAAGMGEYVSSAETVSKVAPSDRVIIRQLGPAQGAIDDPGIRKSLAALVFLAILTLWCVAMLILPRLRDAWRAGGSMGIVLSDRKPNSGFPVVVDEGQNADLTVVADGGRGSERSDAASASSLDRETSAPEAHLFDVPPYRGEDDEPALPARSVR